MTEKRRKIIELANLLRSLTPLQRIYFAEKIELSVGSLYQIAGGHRNAGASLAIRIEKESKGRVLASDLRPDLFKPEQVNNNKA